MTKKDEQERSKQSLISSFREPSVPATGVREEYDAEVEEMVRAIREREAMYGYMYRGGADRPPVERFDITVTRLREEASAAAKNKH